MIKVINMRLLWEGNERRFEKNEEGWRLKVMVFTKKRRLEKTYDKK